MMMTFPTVSVVGAAGLLLGVGVSVLFFSRRARGCCSPSLKMCQGHGAFFHSEFATQQAFLAVASHELKTPLTPLKGSIQVLQRKISRSLPIEPESLQCTLGVMSRQVERLENLVMDCMDTFSIQEGHFELCFQKTELVQMIQRVVVQSFNPRYVAPIVLMLALPDEPVEGIWDTRRLEQLMTQLFENARRYSPRGGKIKIALQAHPDFVVLTVEDEGLGIPSDCYAAIFEPFFKASNASVRNYGGLGLGLFICREIASQHGGNITVVSSGLHRGSVFRVQLPRWRQESSGVSEKKLSVPTTVSIAPMTPLTSSQALRRERS